MRPGLVVQHARQPDRSSELVRSDIAAVIGFVERRRWPEEATAGDLVELVLRSDSDLWNHPDRHLFDPAARRAVRAFFANGGDTEHLFGVCIDSEEDLKTPAACLGVLASLFDRLRAEDDVAILLVPAAAYMAVHWDARKNTVRSDADVLYDQLLAHCREMTNRFLIIDAPRGLHAEPLYKWAETFRKRQTESRSYGAVYYPWLLDGDEVFPPSGTIAGSYARTELEHSPYGVGWPPANTPLRGVTHTEADLSWEEAGELAEQAINPLVVQPGRGVIAFGARTLSEDPTFRHVNSRRIVNMVTEQLRRDSEWAVFETNNPHLWDVLERDVLFRLGEFAGAGMLTGRVAGEDYDAQCDAETNVPALRDAGQVNVRIRMRPVGTVEHILVDLRIGDDSAAGGF
jgi:hypothetical protein